MGEEGDICPNDSKSTLLFALEFNLLFQGLSKNSVCALPRSNGIYPKLNLQERTLRASHMNQHVTYESCLIHLYV